MLMPQSVAAIEVEVQRQAACLAGSILCRWSLSKALRMPHKIETDPVRLRELAARARRLADGVYAPETRDKLKTAAADYEQRAKEIEMDDSTGQ
jgi:hypothetical protein